MNERSKRAKLNIIVSLICQIVTLVCGLVVPKMMIGAFGSEIYGATSSIAQFLAYITLLEGGIGGVARAALYKPLAEKNIHIISSIVNEIRRFFRIIAYIFIAYVFVISLSFKAISGLQALDYISTVFLVLVISISTFGQYFIGISYSVLLQASQRTYINNIVSAIATIINTVIVVVLVNLGCNIIIVKLISSIVFVMRPVALWWYVKKKFTLVKVSKDQPTYLTQKATGLGQHIAFFLHSNTDIIVLTWLSNLTSVAVYSVYNMVVSQIQHLTSSFSSGMEAVFGDMLAKGENDELDKTFGRYDTLISTISTILYSCTATLIVPFVKLYTSGVSDANYIEPLFAIIFVLSAYMTSLRFPYHAMTIAAGHFKETRGAAYGEVLINIGLSIILVFNFGLIGVAIGTLVAVLFRFLYYVVYLSNHIFNRKVSLFVKRMIINIALFFTIFFTGSWIISSFEISTYIQWIFCGCIIAVISVFVTVGVNFVFYRNDFLPLMGRIKKKNRS